MKKKKVNKLSLNKSAISNLGEVNGGVASPIPVGTAVASGCRECISKIRTNCYTDVCTVGILCGLSAWIC
jgi:hypothetical protein